MATPEPIHTELHRIVSTGIVWKKGEDGAFRYLLTKRAPHKKVWPNKWCAPGGGLKVTDYMNGEATYQNSESPQWYNPIEKALRREIREETGVEVDECKLLLDVAFLQPDGTPVIVFSFHCRYAGGEVVLEEDCTEYAWVTAEEAQTYDLIQGIEKEILLVEKALSA